MNIIYHKMYCIKGKDHISGFIDKAFLLRCIIKDIHIIKCTDCGFEVEINDDFKEKASKLLKEDGLL